MTKDELAMTRSLLYFTGIIVVAVLGVAQGDEPQAKKSAILVVEGRVIGDHGAPIAGALVMLGPALDFPRFTAEGTARTDAEGRYHINLIEADGRPSELRSMALATGFAYATGTVEAGSGKAVANFTLKPEAWRTTEIRLADPSGKPAAGVEMTWTLTGNIPWSRTKTDAEGRCRIAMAIGQPIHLTGQARRALGRS